MSISRVATFEFSATGITLVNSTGSYDVNTNTGGYGAPNPEFTDYHHYGEIQKKAVGTDTDSTLTLDTYDPTTATEFSATRDVDGWYEGKIYDILPWSGATAYTGGTAITGSVVSYSGVVYYAIQSGTNHQPDINPLYWTAVSVLSTVSTNVSVLTATVGRVTVYDADLYWSGKIALNSQNGRCGLDPDDRQTKALNRIYFHIQAALVADQLGSNSDGEWSVRTLRTLGAKSAD